MPGRRSSAWRFWADPLPTPSRARSSPARWSTRHQGAGRRRGGDRHLPHPAGRAGGGDRRHRPLPRPAASPRHLHPALREGDLPALLPERHRRRRATAPSASTSSCFPRLPGPRRSPWSALAPIIDVGSSTVGTTINQDFVRNLAVSRPNGLGGANRSFDSLAATAPQRRRTTSTAWRSAARTSPGEQLPHRRPVGERPAYGVNGTPLTIEFIDEVNVITGGYMPEYGRATGGALSATTKSGGNEFHGSVFGHLHPGSLDRAAPRQLTAGGTAVSRSPSDLDNIGDFGATLGGYIIKDRLWFFAGVQLGAPALHPTPATFSRPGRRRGNSATTPRPAIRSTDRQQRPAALRRREVAATTSASSPSSSTPTTASASR